jgi:hypothetical protein
MKSLVYLGWVVLWITGLEAGAEPLARILAVKGEVTIQSDGNSRPAEVFGGLFEKETLAFSPRSSLVLGWSSTRELQRLSVAGNQTVETAVTPGGVDPIGSIRITKIQRDLPPDLFEGLPSISPGAVTVVRSGDDPPPPQIVPLKDSTVAARRPKFSWPAVDDAVGYEFRIYRGRSNDQTWMGKSSLPSLSELPHSLEPGKRYEWKVAAIMADESTQPAVDREDGRFSVATREETAQFDNLAKLQTEVEASDEDLAVLTLIALQYEDKNFKADATRVYEILAKRSADTAAFHAALYALYQSGGRVDEARAARAAAEQLGFEFGD